MITSATMPESNEKPPCKPLSRWPKPMADHDAHRSPQISHIMMLPRYLSTHPHVKTNTCNPKTEAQHRFRSQEIYSERKEPRSRQVTLPRWRSGRVVVLRDELKETGKQSSKNPSTGQEKNGCSSPHGADECETGKMKFPAPPPAVIVRHGKLAIRTPYLANTVGFRRCVLT